MVWFYIILMFPVFGIGYFWATKLKLKEIVQNHPNVLRYKKAVELATEKAKKEAKKISQIAEKKECERAYGRYINPNNNRYYGTKYDWERAQEYRNEELFFQKTIKKLSILQEFVKGKEDESWRLKYEELQEKHIEEKGLWQRETQRLHEEIKALIPYKDEVHRLGGQMAFWKEIMRQESGGNKK